MIILFLLAYHSYCSDIKIYIEALCPNTRSAMTSISNTTIESLDQLAKVHFIPAGKYQPGNEVEENTYYTKCQHLEKECYGNMLLACALDLLENQKNATQFVKCFFQNVKTGCSERDQCFVEPLNECLSKDQRIRTLMCANGPQGIEMLFQNIKLTHKLSYVPSIYLNGKLMTLGDKDDFGRVICKNDQSIEVCKDLKWL